MSTSIATVSKRLTWPLLGLISTAALGLELQHLRSTSGRAATSTPAVSATPAVETSGVAAEGRLVTYPGGLVTVSSDVAGTLVRLSVDERDVVRRGQLLAELKADDLAAELAEARARAAEAEADLRFAEVDAGRAERLLAGGAGTQAALDRSRSTRDADLARLATARATIERLAAVLAKTRIVAPRAGTVVERDVQPGEHIEAGKPLLALADLGHTRIEAEVDEFDAGRVALGAPVAVTAEGFEGRSWRGHVEEIPDTVVTRRLKPQDPGKPSDTRVLLVKVALDEPTPLKLSQRVEVSIRRVAEKTAPAEEPALGAKVRR